MINNHTDRFINKETWDERSLLARIKNFNLRKRFEAGSPDDIEIEAYARSFSSLLKFDSAVVLGMTPELRILATRFFKKVITIDKSKTAIELYKDWNIADYNNKEIIIQADWSELSDFIVEPVDVILGDGVFGNLLSIKNHTDLLNCIASCLDSSGIFITRNAIIPNNFDSKMNNVRELLVRFRKGEISEAEFGFGVRLLGHYACCYNQDDFILDNKKLFEECEDDFSNGKFTKNEYSCILRYYFNGKNCIIPQALWENLLSKNGFMFEINTCFGKHWYSYYLVYSCKLKSKA